MKTTLSKFAEAILYLKGKKFSFDGYDPFRYIYDTNTQSIVLKAGRQIGKSVSVAGRITAESILRRYFNSLYLTPLSGQASKFSTMYLDPYLDQGLVKKHFRDSNSTKNIFEKSLTTGSRIFLGYGSDELEVNRLRGISADSVYLDEVQDIDYGAVPVVKETLSASPYAFMRMSGTSKTLNNSLEFFWNQSNQSEWGVKCSSCNTWNIPHDLDTCMKMSSSKAGPSCIKCGSVLNMLTGQWIVGRSTNNLNAGYHLPQIIFTVRTSDKKWGELYDKVNKTYTLVQAANEVFGLAHDFASRPITLQDCLNCCNKDRKEFDESWTMDTRSIVSVSLGVDWSVTAGTASFTVISIMGFDYTGKAYLLYSERLQGIDILDQVARVRTLAHLFNVNIIGSDRGVGVLQGQLLQRDLGLERVKILQYTSGKENIRWDQLGHFFSVNRTQAIDRVVYMMKQGRRAFETPCWERMETFYNDALAIFDEETASGVRVYRKDPTRTDDWLHSIVFAIIAYEVLTQQTNVEDTFDAASGPQIIEDLNNSYNFDF